MSRDLPLQKPTMLTTKCGPFVVIVHGREQPTDAAWEASLEVVRSMSSLDRVRVLVYSAGGAPNGRQRAALNKITSSLKMRIAVLTDSVIARAVRFALRWFDAQVQIFPPEEIEAALTHVEAMGQYRAMLRSTVVELRAGVGDLDRVREHDRTG